MVSWCRHFMLLWYCVIGIIVHFIFVIYCFLHSIVYHVTLFCCFVISRYWLSVSRFHNISSWFCCFMLVLFFISVVSWQHHLRYLFSFRSQELITLSNRIPENNTETGYTVVMYFFIIRHISYIIVSCISTSHHHTQLLSIDFLIKLCQDFANMQWMNANTAIRMHNSGQ